ncbi:unnamed protein product [Sphagnum jensenii]
MHADVRSFGRLFVRRLVDPFVGSYVRSLVRRFVRLLVRPSVRPSARAAAEERGERDGERCRRPAAAGAGIQTFVAIFATAITLSGAAALLCFPLLRSNRQMGPRQMHVVASGSGAYFVHSSSGFPLCTSSSFSLSHFSSEEVE